MYNGGIYTVGIKTPSNDLKAKTPLFFKLSNKIPHSFTKVLSAYDSINNNLKIIEIEITMIMLYL